MNAKKATFHEIQERLCVMAEEVRMVQSLLSGKADPMSFEDARRHYAQCYHEPDDHMLRMLALNELLELCGVEPLRQDQFSGPVGEFLNTGESYCPTICYRYDTKEYLLLSLEEFQRLMLEGIEPDQD